MSCSPPPPASRSSPRLRRRRSEAGRSASSATRAQRSTAPTAARSSSARLARQRQRRSTRSTSTTTCAASSPLESPSLWPTEALKAQAVAARTYALTTSRTARASTTTRHALAGLRRRGRRAGVDERGRARDRGPARDLPGQAGRDLLLLHLRRADRGRREHRLGTAPQPWLKSVEDKYDDVSPQASLGADPDEPRRPRARSSAGSCRGASAASRCSTRGGSPRIVAADVVGSAGDARRRRDAARAARALRHLGVLHLDRDRQGAEAPPPADDAGGRGRRTARAPRRAPRAGSVVPARGGRPGHGPAPRRGARITLDAAARGGHDRRSPRRAATAPACAGAAAEPTGVRLRAATRAPPSAIALAPRCRRGRSSRRRRRACRRPRART